MLGDGLHPQRGRKMAFPGARPADENNVVRRAGEAEVAELADQRPVHVEARSQNCQVTVDGELGRP